MHKLSVAWSLPTESLVRMPKSTNSSHIPYQWDNCNTKRSRSPWNTNDLTVLSNKILCFFAQSIWTLEFLLTFLTLSFYTSCVSPPVGVTMIHNRHVLSNARTFFRQRFLRNFYTTFYHFLCCASFAAVSHCPSVGLGRKKGAAFCSVPLLAALSPSRGQHLTTDFLDSFTFWEDLINRLNNPTLADHVGDTCMYKVAASLPSPPCHSQPLRRPLTVQIASQSDFKYIWEQNDRTKNESLFNINDSHCCCQQGVATAVLANRQNSEREKNQERGCC